MVGQCKSCKQIKNLVGQGLCSTCYHRQLYQNKRKNARKCLICGTVLRNNNYFTCTHCRTHRAVLERKAQVISKYVENTEKNIKICLEYICGNTTYEKLAEKYNLTKGGIGSIVTQGLDYYNQKLVELKKQYDEYTKQIKEYELRLNG